MLEPGFILVAVGVYAGANFLYSSVKSLVEVIWNVCFGDRRPLSERYGPWAVITGSSDGIGKEYAINLARKGLNVVLVSRTESKLIKVEEEILSQCNVEVRIVPVDFAKGPSVYKAIEKALEGLDIGILVNNVGQAHDHPRYLEELPLYQIEQTVTVNLLPTVNLIYTLLPQMKLRRRGMIVNVTSTAGLFPVPLLAMYASTKTFLNRFTQSLQVELRGTGVNCQLVHPMFVDTNLIQQWDSLSIYSVLSAPAQRFGRMAVWMIGKTRETTGYWAHGFQLTVLKVLPLFYMLPVTRILFKQLRDGQLNS